MIVKFQRSQIHKISSKKWLCRSSFSLFASLSSYTSSLSLFPAFPREFIAEHSDIYILLRNTLYHADNQPSLRHLPLSCYRNGSRHSLSRCANRIHLLSMLGAAKEVRSGLSLAPRSPHATVASILKIKSRIVPRGLIDNRNLMRPFLGSQCPTVVGEFLSGSDFPRVLLDIALFSTVSLIQLGGRDKKRELQTIRYRCFDCEVPKRVFHSSAQRILRSEIEFRQCQNLEINSRFCRIENVTKNSGDTLIIGHSTRFLSGRGDPLEF